MSKLDEYLKQQRTVKRTAPQDPMEHSIQNFIRKTKRSKYTDEEVTRGLMKIFHLSKEQAIQQMEKYNA